MALFVVLVLALSATSAERKITVAKLAVQIHPTHAQSYNELAEAYCARARESDDVAFYSQAQTALNHSVQIAPSDYPTRKLQTVVLLGLHRSAEALAAAKALNRRVPDDVAVWSYLSEANLQLGNIKEAETAAQWMFDLRPGNTAAYLIAAKVREAEKDSEGALDSLNEAFRRTPENEPEVRANILVESARISLAMGERTRAQSRLAEALQLYPSSQAALKLGHSIRKNTSR